METITNYERHRRKTEREMKRLASRRMEVVSRDPGAIGIREGRTRNL